MNKAIFLDRDGTIIRHVDFLNKASQIRLLRGVARAIVSFKKLGFLVIIVTNQPIIAKGFCTFDDIDKVHEKMNKLLAQNGAKIDAVYICPHHPERGFKGEISELKIECNCRKPKPGLLLQAMKEHNISANESWMIGDKESDIIAGKNAGCRTILLTSEKRISFEIMPHKILSNLAEAVDYIVNN